MIGWCSAWGAELHYRDLRKLRGLWPLPPGSGIDTISGPQGPDALGVSLASLLKRLASRRGIKVVLMDQSKLAGLGNMLSDEVLWRSRIYPAQPANTLDEVEIRRLYSALTATLRASVRAEHVPRTSQWLASQRDRRDPQCPQCDAVLQRTSGWPKENKYRFTI